MGILDSIKEKDTVEIEAFCDGKVSRNSGIQYNNLVALSVKNI